MMNQDQGIYAQDSWTLGRFTINPGVRFEHFNGSIGERGVAAGRFVPARHFDAKPDVPNWNDVAPRFGFAWDIQGNGKTARQVRHRQVRPRLQHRLRRDLRSRTSTAARR